MFKYIVKCYINKYYFKYIIVFFLRVCLVKFKENVFRISLGEEIYILLLYVFEKNIK